MTDKTTTRPRLLDAAEVATKLNISPSRITRRDRRYDLEVAGFPPPVLGGDGSTMPVRWDEKAIDRWLDSRMPLSLQDFPNASTDTAPSSTAIQPTDDMDTITARLRSRAQQLPL